MSSPAPEIPPCGMSLLRHIVGLMGKEIETAPRWDAEFEVGRRCFDTQYPAAWHALSETFTPLGKMLEQMCGSGRVRIRLFSNLCSLFVDLAPHASSISTS